MRRSVEALQGITPRRPCPCGCRRAMMRRNEQEGGVGRVDEMFVRLMFMTETGFGFGP